MRLYITVAILTFLGSFGVYSATQMTGVANAIGAGGTGNGTSYAALFRNFNPLTLLQRERLQAIASSGEGIPRVEPFSSRFDASNTIRALRPQFDPELGRKAWTGPPSYVFRPPVVNTPVYRPYR